MSQSKMLLADFEEVIVVIAHVDDATPSTMTIQAGNGESSNAWVDFAGGETTVDGSTSTLPPDPGGLRVVYADTRLSVAELEGLSRVNPPSAMFGAFALGFLSDTYDETNPEDISWAVPYTGFAGPVGEVARID